MKLVALSLIAIAACTSASAKPLGNSAVALAEAAVRTHLADPGNGRFIDAKVTGSCGGSSYVVGHLTGRNALGGEARPTIFLVRVEGHVATVMQALGNTYATDAEFEAANDCAPS